MPDKLTIGFIADILYFKGILNYEEIDAIFDAKTAEDLQAIVDKIMRSEFSAYKRGEHYEQSDRIAE